MSVAEAGAVYAGTVGVPGAGLGVGAEEWVTLAGCPNRGLKRRAEARREVRLVGGEIR